jgi:hypothetical protein
MEAVNVTVEYDKEDRVHKVVVLVPSQFPATPLLGDSSGTTAQGDGGNAAKKRRTKDPHAPKHPRTPFMYDLDGVVAVP